MLGSDEDNADGPDLLEVSVFESFLNRHYCSFLSYDNDFHLDGLSSGVFVTYRDRFFVATAGHVLRDLPEKWALSYGQRFSHRRNQGGKPVLADPDLLERELGYNDFGSPQFRVQDIVPRRDVGLIEIRNIDRLQRCGNDFLELSRENLSVPSLESRLEIWGECAEILHENLSDGKKNQITRLATKLKVKPETEELRYTVDYGNLCSTELHLKDGSLKHETERTETTRHPGGMSGGPVWMLSEENEKDGIFVVENPKLVGIQSAVRRDGEDSVLLVCKLEDWMNLADEIIDGVSKEK